MTRLDQLPRRGVLAGGLVAGFTMATERVLAQAIHTGTEGLDAGEAEIPTSDGHIPAYYARPKGDRLVPVVVVIEEIFGVHEYIRDVCRRLAHEGYLAVAPELYARIADLSTMTDARQIVRDVISKAPDQRMLLDLDSAAAWATTRAGDPGRIGVTGFCRGGRDTWLFAAHNPALKAAVAWYGPLGGGTSAIQPQTPLDLVADLRCPLLGLYAGQDPSSSPAQIKEAEEKARAAGRTVEFVVYPDAPHGFHADYRPSYRAADARDGWARMLAWFRKMESRSQARTPRREPARRCRGRSAEKWLPAGRSRFERLGAHNGKPCSKRLGSPA